MWRLFLLKLWRGLFESCSGGQSGHLLGALRFLGTFSRADGRTLLRSLFPTGSPHDELGREFTHRLNRRAEPRRHQLPPAAAEILSQPRVSRSPAD